MHGPLKEKKKNSTSESTPCYKYSMWPYKDLSNKYTKLRNVLSWQYIWTI